MFFRILMISCSVVGSLSVVSLWWMFYMIVVRGRYVERGGSSGVKKCYIGILEMEFVR